MRNTKIVDIYSTLSEYTGNVTVYDPWADAIKAKREYGIELTKSSLVDLKGQFDVVILGVAHNVFKNEDIRSFLKYKDGVVYDVKGVLDKEVVDGRL